MRISIIGLGYVGLSNALLLCQKYDVVGVDIDYEKVIAINNGYYSIKDSLVSKGVFRQYVHQIILIYFQICLL